VELDESPATARSAHSVSTAASRSDFSIGSVNSSVVKFKCGAGTAMHYWRLPNIDRGLSQRAGRRRARGGAAKSETMYSAIQYVPGLRGARKNRTEQNNNALLLRRQFTRGAAMYPRAAPPNRSARPKWILGSRSAVASTALSHNVVQVVPLSPPPPAGGSLTASHNR
jgi:hypothetical protein